MSKTLLRTAFTFLLGWVMGILPCQSQILPSVDCINTGIFVVQDSSTLTFQGSFFNTDAAQFSNKGQILFRKDFFNYQPNLYSPGIFSFSGNVLQHIAGLQPVRVATLITDNAAGIFLENSIEVKNQHQFLNGLITSASSNTYLAYEDGTQITGTSDHNHVIGWVRKSGSADFTFPVGDSQFLRTVSVKNLSQASWFAVSYAAPGLNPTQVAAPLVSAHPNEYWWINRLQGGSATVELNWDATKVTLPFRILNDLRGGYYQNQVWNNRGGLVAGDVLTSGTVLLNDQNEFGAFAVATIGSLVPLKLLSFTGERKKGYSALYWTSTNEATCDKFIVERSEDALHFVPIGEVKALNLSAQTNYGFTDYLPVTATAWYRLHILDQSSTGLYSRVIALRETDKGQLSLLNNPASGVLYISSGNAQSGLYSYQLISVSGQLYQKGDLEIRGNAVTTLPLRASVRSGLYILTLQKDQFRFTKQVLIQ